MMHYPINGNRMLKAVCGASGVGVRKASDAAKVTCPACRASLAEQEREMLARMNREHPGASWHFVTHHTTGERVLVSVPND